MTDLFDQIVHSGTLRLIAMLQLLALLFFGTYLVQAYRHSFPRVLYVAAFAYLWVLIAGMVSLGWNLALHANSTPGLIVYTVALAPATATSGVAFLIALDSGFRHRRGQLPR